MVQPQAYYPDRTPIASEQLPDAIKTGQAGYLPGSVVNMIGPDGKRYKAKAEAVPGAFAKGFRPESPEESEANDYQAKFNKAANEHPVLAGVAAYTKSAADTLATWSTLGASDVLKQTGPEIFGAPAGALLAPGGPVEAVSRTIGPGYDKGMAAVQKASPLATTAGQVTGAVGSLVVPGPTVAGVLSKVPALARVGKAATGIAESGGIIGRAGLSAVEHSIEGGVQGSAMSMAEEYKRASMANDDITAERMLAAGGKGLGIGAILGFGLGGLGSLGKSAVVHSAEKGVLSPETNALMALGITNAQKKRLIKQHGFEGTREFGKEIIRSQEAGGGTLAVTGGLEARATAASKLIETRGKGLERFYDDLEKSGATLDRSALLTKAAEKTSELRSGTTHLIDAADDLEKKFIEIPKGRTREKIVTEDGREIPGFLNEASTFKEVWTLRKYIDKLAKDPVTGKIVNEEYYKFARTIENEVERQVEAEAARLGGELSGKYEKLKTDYHLLRSVSDMVKENAAKEMGRAPFSPKDVYSSGFGVIAAGMHGGLAGLGVSKLAHALSSPTGAAIMARALNKVRGGTDATAIKAGNAMEDILKKNALYPGRERLPAFASKIASQFIDSSSAPKDSKHNPEVAISRITSAVTPVAYVNPNLARATANTLTGDLKWLADNLPGQYSFGPLGSSTSGTTVKGIEATMGGKGRKLPRIPLSEMSRYNRKEKALSDPVGQVLEMSRSGKMNPELPKVLNQRRPMLQQQLNHEMNENLMKMLRSGRRPTHTSLIQMSQIIGKPLDVTMSQQFISMSQTVWAENAVPQEEAPPTRSSGRRVSESMRNRAQDRATASEDIEKGR
jgi:hypothetical protein